MATPGYKIIGPDGRETAPFDSDALVNYARAGYVQPHTQVFDPTIGQWIPASQVNALAALNAALRVPPAPMPPVPPVYSYPMGAMQSASNKAPFPRWLAATIGIAVGVLVAFTIVGITRIAKQASTNQTISTADSLYTVSIPGLWHKYQARDPEVVEYISFGTGVVMVRVTAYPPADTDLDRVTSNVVASSERNLNVSSLHSEPIVTSVAGYPARQFEINDDGHVGFHRFRKTLIATPDGIYDVTTFARTYNVDRDRAVLDSVLASFHRLGTSSPASH